MRGGCGRTGGHRADQNPAASGPAERFAVLSATGERRGVVAGPVRASLEWAEAMFGCAGAQEVEDGEIVGVIEVVEFRGAKNLRFLVESGVLAEVPIGQSAEFVERNDVGDFVAVDRRPALARRRKSSVHRSRSRDLLGQRESSLGP